jgi:hypothetical protein
VLGARSTPRIRRIAAATLAAAGCCLAGILGAGGARAQPTTLEPAALAAELTSVANGIATQWTAHELPSGALVDPVLGPLKGDYGDAMTGQAMVVAGLGENEPDLVARGIQAELADAAHPDDGGFELLALSGAYSVNQRALAQDPTWLAARPRIARFLRRHKAAVSDLGLCYTNPHCYTNLKLVAAVAEISLLQTGLRSGEKDALLRNRHALHTRAFGLLAMAAANAGDDAYRLGGDGFSASGILSDPNENPLAYHALSTAMLGRAILLLSAHTPAAIGRAFARTAKALVGLLAPDASGTYIGRGQAQVWTIGVTIDALAIAAELTSDPIWRGRYLTGLALSLERLESLYPSRGWGLPLVPRFAGETDPRDYAGIDPYANTVEYNGLVLWALDDAASALAHVQDAPAQALPSTTDGVFVDPSHAQFAAATHGSLWFAVHALDSNLGDPRYGFGLIAAELDGPNGWQSVLPAPPFTRRHVIGSIALRSQNAPLYPIGRRITATPGGVVTVKGGWQRSVGAKLVHRGTTWTFTPSAAGVRLTTAAPAGSSFELQVWYLAGAQLTVSPHDITVTEPNGTTQSYAANTRLHILHGVAASSAYAASLRSLVLLAKPRTGSLVYTTTFGLSPATGSTGTTGTSAATGATGTTS